MTQRLFIPDALSTNAAITLNGPPAHYLLNVLRLSAGAPILLFNGRDGEWTATLETLSKKAVVARAVDQSRQQDQVPDITLLFAPVKGDRIDGIIEKACELGVRAIQPIITTRTIVRKVNTDRLLSRAIEAAEQTGRLSIPEIKDAISLDVALDQHDLERLIVFADEAGDKPSGFLGGPQGRAAPMAQSLAALQPRSEKFSLLIGPEGGFTPEERARLRGKPSVLAVSLGPRILRADTAVFAGLTLLQAIVGDWVA